MSKNYSKVKKYYDNGNWSIDRLRMAVIKSWITTDEFYDITGKEYY